MENKKDNIAIITADDLSLVSDNSLNEKQLQFILKHTPKQYVHDRPAKGGGTWKFVSGGYIKKCLNLMFGFRWSFEIISEQVIGKQVIVKGRLTCHTNSGDIIKMQYGRKDIICRKNSDEFLDIGNDMKAAATDCLKKCASEIGIAADIYNADEFREVTITSDEDLYAQLKELFDLKQEALTNSEIEDIAKIVHEKQSNSYKKAIKFLISK